MIEKINFEDLLIQKPISLIYWEFSDKFEKIMEVLSKETEVKIISEFRKIDYWKRIGKIKNLVFGIKSEKNFEKWQNFLKSLKPEERRGIFAILISENVKTLDPVKSFVFNVNLVINLKDLDKFEEIYQKSKLYWTNLYKEFLSFKQNFR